MRNADEYYENMKRAAQSAGCAENTFIVAPLFLIDKDKEALGFQDDIPFWGGWTGDGWKIGDQSLAQSADVSSFAVLDALVAQVVNSPSFPNVKDIVIAGHSAGGQFVNRYAAGTAIQGLVPESIQLRFVVSNPSSYVYLNADRASGTDPITFSPPANVPANYNHYKHGLEQRNDYMSQKSVEAIRSGYLAKSVTYLLGGQDTSEEWIEQGAAANLKGPNRLARGQTYYRHLHALFGQAVDRSHSIVIVPCVGHDNAAMWISPLGQNCLFLSYV